MGNPTDKFLRTIELETEDGFTKSITIKVLPAYRGMSFLYKTMKAIGPAAAKFMDGSGRDEFEHGASTMFEDIVEEVFKTVDEKFIEDFVSTMLKGASIEVPGQNPSDLNVDSEFMANYGELFEVLKFAFMENFGKSKFGKKSIGHLLSQVTKITEGTDKK